MNNELEKAKEKTVVATEVTETVQKGTTDIVLSDVAQIQARLESYKLVSKNYEDFIVSQAKKLKAKDFEDNTYKELGMARLVAQWMVETEEYFKTHEDELEGKERVARKGFINEALAELPEDLRKEILLKIEDRRHELMMWLASELTRVQKIANEREK